MSGVLALTKLEHFIGTSTSILLDVFTITLFTGWIVYFIVKCWRLYKEYRTCKQTPNTIHNYQLSNSIAYFVSSY